MSSLSKSPKAVAKVAYEVAKRSLPEYRHRYSPKKFTQHQLAAILILREFFKTDYRGIEAILKDSRDLQEVLYLLEVPHFTTIQKTAQRMKKKDLNRLLSGFLALAQKERVLKKNVALSAIDGTGFESRHISSYFVKRKARGQDIYRIMTYTRYPKAGIVADCSTLLVLSIVTGRGPGPDIVHFEKAICEAEKNVHLKTLTTDAGYDSERAHRFAREEHGIRTIIPRCIGRPTTKLPTGKYRKIMATRFNKTLYGQRWQVETVNSMIKRVLGSAMRARTYWSQCREMFMRVLAYNVMVLWV